MKRLLLILALLLTPSNLCFAQKISALPADTTPTSAALMVTVEGGVTSKSTIAQVLSGGGVITAADDTTWTGLNTFETTVGMERQATFIFDGGGSAVTASSSSWLRAVAPFTIESVQVTADQLGTVVVDIWKDTFENFPPADSDSITSSTPPTLLNTIKSEDTTLTSWTTTVTEGDYMKASIDSATTVTYVEVNLYGN